MKSFLANGLIVVFGACSLNQSLAQSFVEQRALAQAGSVQGGPAQRGSTQDVPTQGVSTQGALAEAAKLQALFKRSNEENLRLNPLNALSRNDLRYADQFGDYISEAYYAEQKANIVNDLAALKTIDRSRLALNDQIALDVFAYQRSTDLIAFETDLYKASQLRPIDHFSGMHQWFAEIASGQSFATFKTVDDYENNLKRWDGYVQYLARAQSMMEQGLVRGYVHPRLVAKNVVDQLSKMIALPQATTPFLMPLKSFPADFSPEQKSQLTIKYQTAYRNNVVPALSRLHRFMRDHYLPKTRVDKPGLVGMRDGLRVYELLVREQTTTTLSADEIHQIGLSEVARIKQGMEQVKNQVGFKQSLPLFFKHLGTDPQFKFKTKSELLAGYQSIWNNLQAKIPALFNTSPKTPFEIRPIPEYMEKNQAAAYYSSGSPDGLRPGVFYINTYALPSRTKPGMETLFLHEAIPGHHFQIALAIENTALPDFMRFEGNTAFAEGWALYAESLGPELGLFTDPYQLFGRYDDEMLRAMRLVVDTGLHSKGWSKEKAVAYMKSNSSMSKHDAVAEVERYIAIPGQALAYKIGELKIRQLRSLAENELKSKFDIRKFHDQVLNSGALPLSVLETKIKDWIERERVA